MMKMNCHEHFIYWRLLLCLLIHILSIALFIYGFFPEASQKTKPAPSKLAKPVVNNSSSSKSVASFDCAEGEQTKSKLIFVVIDAWRADFLSRNGGQSMPFLNGLLQEKRALNCITSVQLPTVTLPRIKALTSGTQSSFLDAIFNFAASDSTEDNWLDLINNRQTIDSDQSISYSDQRTKSPRILFFGDDTWLKLYPHNRFLPRSEGTTSFFVSDFYEVDNNATENVRKEFSRTLADPNVDDWELMILHYLGLDHIGHSLGANNELIGLKLTEMDSILQEIYQNCTKLFVHCSLLVTGDHGMTDAGTHGAASANERTVSTVYLPYTIRTDQSAPSISKQCSMNQVDLAATISVLRGVPTPANSLGVISTDFVGLTRSKTEVACLLKNNLRQLMRLMHFENGNSLLQEAEELLATSLDGLLWIDVSQLHSKLYSVCKRIQMNLMNVSSSHNDKWIYIGIGMNFLLTMYLVICRLSLPYCDKGKQNDVGQSTVQYSLVFGIVMIALSRFSSSFVEEEHMLWHYLLVSWLFLAMYFEWAPARVCDNHKYSPKLYNCALLLAVLMCLRMAQGYVQGGVKWIHLSSATTVLISSSVWRCVLVCLSMLYVLLVSCVTVTVGRAHKPRPSVSCARMLITLIVRITALAALVLYRYCNADLDGLSPLLAANHKLGAVQSARLVYLCIFVMMVFGNFEWCMLTISLLLCRAEHCGLVVLIDWLGRLSSSFIGHNQYTSNTRVLLLYVLMNAAFFYTGNTNHFGSIDVSRGYIGLSSYKPVLCALLIVLHAYWAPALTATHFYIRSKSWSETGWQSGMSMFVAIRCMSLCSYMLVLYTQRYHLFVWSVFAPKLFYEIAHSCLLAVIVVLFVMYDLLIALFCFCSRKTENCDLRTDKMK